MARIIPDDSRAEAARIRDLPKAWRLADEQKWLDDYDARCKRMRDTMPGRHNAPYDALARNSN